MSEMKRMAPLLTDISDETSTVKCASCTYLDGCDVENELYWYEYSPSLQTSGRVCNHCGFPPPKNVDLIMCAREKHLYCLYCIELKLFRVQLARFVMVSYFIVYSIYHVHTYKLYVSVSVNQELDDTDDLSIEWERDYVDYQKTSHRGRSHSLADTLSNKRFCCFTKKQTTAFIESTTNLQVSALRSHSIVDRNKQKRNSVQTKSNTDDMKLNEMMSETEIDELYDEEYAVNDDGQVMIQQNKKKVKAVELLLAACKKGTRFMLYTFHFVRLCAFKYICTYRI